MLFIWYFNILVAAYYLDFMDIVYYIESEKYIEFSTESVAGGTIAGNVSKTRKNGGNNNEVCM